MSSCTVIVSASIKNQEKVDAYKLVAGPIMKKYNATLPPESYSVSQVLAGQAQPTFMLKINFANKSDALAAFNDPEYLAVIQARDEGFGDASIFIVE